MLTLALIGVGRWGKNIVSTLENIPEANLKYLCARDMESMTSYSDKYEKVIDWRKLSEKKDLAAVLIATPANTHLEISEYFLSKNIPVFTEKPMVLNLEEAKRLKMSAKNNGAVFMVGYQYVFNDYINYVKNEINTGSFGKILSIKSEQALIPQSADTDVFGDAGPHPLSIFQYLFNPSELISVEGKIEHDSAVVTIQFTHAPKLHIETRSFNDVKIRKLTIIGEKITAVLDETLKENKLSMTKNDGVTTYPKITSNDSLRNELEHFIFCVKNKSEPLTDISFGYKVTEWLEIISKKMK